MNPDPHAATRPCPDCGAANPDGAAACWLCHRPLAGATESAAPKSISAPQLGDLPTHGPVLRVVLMLTLILVALGLFYESPGLGILFVVPVLPVVVRIYMGTRQGRANRTSADTFFIILGMIVTIGVAAVAAHLAICYWGISREEPGSGQPVPEAGRNSIVLLAIALVYSAAFLLWVRILRLRRK